MSETKELTYSDVSEHTTKKDLYVVIHDKVYNASSFIDEHPYVHLPLPHPNDFQLHVAGNKRADENQSITAAVKKSC